MTAADSQGRRAMSRLLAVASILLALGCVPPEVSAQHFQLKYSTRIESVTPNPFDNRVGSVEIKIVLVIAGAANLSIYSLDGRLVVVLLNEELGVGPRTVYWNGRTRDGALVPSGTYIIKLEVGDMRRTANVVVAR